MFGKEHPKQLNRAKKIAAKGGMWLNVATLYLAAVIISSKIYKYVKTPLWRVVSTAALCLIFVATASFAPVDGINAQTVVDYGYEEMDEAEIEALENGEVPEEFIADSGDDEDDGASLDDLLEHIDEEDEETVGSEENVGDSEITFDKTAWNLLLINKQHPAPDDYTFTLDTIKGSMKCDERIITPLAQMFKAAADDGINLEVRSPYRDISRQEYLFDRKMKLYLNRGYSYMDAYKEASSVVTVPGASEHQIGISLDITSDTYSVLDEGFENTEAGKWLKDNSYRFGFILRYPKGKEDITGIIYEPWHYRYVGVDAATVIYERGITLEEFIDSL